MMTVILCGVSGSGKSRYVEESRSSVDDVCSADGWFSTHGQYVFDPRQLGAAHAYCLRQYVTAVLDARPRTIWVDNTNTTTEEMAPYVALAQAYGSELTIATFLVDPRLAYERGKHAVPLATIEAMDKRLRARVFPPHWRGIKHEIVGGS